MRGKEIGSERELSDDYDDDDYEQLSIFDSSKVTNCLVLKGMT